jgi:3-hydroxybutyryl-CoA dehydrogenase
MKNIAVIGAGVMGHGAAQLFAQAGYNVRIQARRESSLEEARALITSSLKIMVEKEILIQEEMDQTLTNITYTLSLIHI